MIGVQIWGGFHFEKMPIHNKLFIFQMSIFFSEKSVYLHFLNEKSWYTKMKDKVKPLYLK